MLIYILTIIGKALFAILVIHVTVLAITLYLHRGMTHQSVKYKRAMDRFFKTVLFFACGMNPESQLEWIVVHRKHHAETDTQNDPHNPAQKGAWKLFFGAFVFYRQSVKEVKRKLLPNKSETEYQHYSKDIRFDSFDRILNRLAGILGLGMSCLLYTCLLGSFGFVVWIAQTLWMPFVAGGVINVLGHTVGQRPYNSSDSSRSLAPQSAGFLGWRWILVVVLNWATGGEHLHNPHHFRSSSARFGTGTGLNFDIGYWWIRLFEKLGYVTTLQVANL